MSHCFDWDAANIAHIAEHNVQPHEAEEVYNNNPVYLDYLIEDGEQRHREIGETLAGRILIVVSTTSPNSMEKRIIPKFESEAEEAKWWFDNREELDKDFAKAFAEGRLQRRTAPRTSIAVPTTTIRLDPVDIQLARELAEKRGLKYQTYLKMLIHEALTQEAQARESKAS